MYYAVESALRPALGGYRGKLYLLLDSPLRNELQHCQYSLCIFRHLMNRKFQCFQCSVYDK